MSIHFHHVQGRFRVRLPAVKGCIAHARALEASLASVHGVTHVECRTVTGSVIVHYDPSAVDAVALMRSLGHEHASGELVGASPASARRKRLPAKAVQGILWFVLESVAERAVPILLAAVL